MKKVLILTLGLFSLLLSSCGIFNPKEEKKECTFTFNGEHCAMNHKETYIEGTNISLYINIEEGYELSEDIEVSGCDDYSYDYETSIFDAVITDDTVVTVKTDKIKYINYVMGYFYETENETITFTIDEDIENRTFVVTKHQVLDSTNYILKITKKFNEHYMIEEEKTERYADEKRIYTTIDRYEYSEENILDPKKVSSYIINELGEEELVEYVESSFYDATSPYKGQLKEKVYYNVDTPCKKLCYEYSEEYIYKKTRYLFQNANWVFDYSETYYVEDDPVNKLHRYYSEYFEENDGPYTEIIEGQTYDYSNGVELLVKDASTNYYESYEYNENNDLLATKEYYSAGDAPDLLRGCDYIYDEAGILQQANQYYIDDKTKEQEIETIYEYKYNEDGCVDRVVIDGEGYTAVINYDISKRKNSSPYIGPFVFAQTIGNYSNVNDLQLGYLTEE